MIIPDPEWGSFDPWTHERIRRRAYELYEQRGRAPGHALDDWLRAERELFVEDAIRLKAYQLYEQRGRAPGHALDDWLRAERDLFEDAVRSLKAYRLYEQRGWFPVHALVDWEVDVWTKVRPEGPAGADKPTSD